MRRLTMSRHRRRDASYPEAAKRRSYVSPFYESKYWLPPGYFKPMVVGNDYAVKIKARTLEGYGVRDGQSFGCGVKDRREGRNG